jgi:hypothetical protein
MLILISLGKHENSGVDMIQPHVTEEPLKYSRFEIPDAFNDTSIHTFPANNLQAKPREFWENVPTYVSDVELIPAHLLS